VQQKKLGNVSTGPWRGTLFRGPDDDAKHTQYLVWFSWRKADERRRCGTLVDGGGMSVAAFIQSRALCQEPPQSGDEVCNGAFGSQWECLELVLYRFGRDGRKVGR